MNSTKKIAVLLSVFNVDIASRLKQEVLKELKKNNIKDFEITEVPGVVEIPLVAQNLFKSGYQSVIALGSVIRGETTHYEACCRLVEQGCMQVQLKFNRPLIFGILMTETKQQAFDRTGGVKGNVAQASVQIALKMLSVIKPLKNIQSEDKTI